VDSQYTPEELPEHAGWGHSSWKQAIESGIEAGAKKIALYHHDPYHEDSAVEEILQSAMKLHPNVIAAREGLEVTI
jgi:ribonuclease BN (tRNA processing enzyme)